MIMKILSKRTVKIFGIAALISSIPLTLFAYTDTYFYATSYLYSIGYIEGYKYISAGSANFVGNSSYMIGFVGNSNTTNSGVSRAMAVGYGLVVRDSDSLVAGTWNSDSGGDELLILGNGSYGVPSNALEVFKNGNMNVYGSITCSPGGDIPMFGE